MSVYRFLSRDSEGQTHEKARATVIGRRAQWEGDLKLRSFLLETPFGGLDGENFDPSNPTHWKLLPRLIAGSRLWVVEGEGDQGEPLAREGEAQEKTRHRRDKCMVCSAPPQVDVHWADGRGRAWFCLRHFKDWAREEERDIVRCWFVANGEVPEKIGDEGAQVRKVGEQLSTEQLIERLEQLADAQKDGAAAKAKAVPADPYVRLPPDPNAPQPYMLHLHARGASVHGDLRFRLTKDLLVGWTMAVQMPGALPDIESVAQLRQLSKDPSRWKVNFTTGQFRKRQVRGGTVRKTAILCFEKAPEPIEWMKVEGRVEPGSVGATSGEAGVFYIADKGVMAYGAQKPWSHEYFLWGGHGLAPGRYLLRALGHSDKEAKPVKLGEFLESQIHLVLTVLADRMFAQGFIDRDTRLTLSSAIGDALAKFHELTEEVGDELSPEDVKLLLGLAMPQFSEAAVRSMAAAILPPAEEKGGRDIHWQMMQVEEQAPYVLRGAVSKDWLPPVGHAALPPALLKLVPKDAQYWQKGDTATRLAKRRAAVEAIGDKADKWA